MSKHAFSSTAGALVFVLARSAAAQPLEPLPGTPPDPAAPALPPASDPLAEPPPAPVAPVPPEYPDPREGQPEPMSEGRRIVVAYNTEFQWGLSPGVVFAGGKTSFFLGLRFGYGFDTGKVIIVPGVRLAGYFTDPNVYLGMPVLKLVYPIDRFAPFVEAGAGLGYISGFDVDSRTSVDPVTGLAVVVGGGFMVHFTWKFGLGVEASYQTIVGSDFHGFGIGPTIALAF